MGSAVQTEPGRDSGHVISVLALAPTGISTSVGCTAIVDLTVTEAACQTAVRRTSEIRTGVDKPRAKPYALTDAEVQRLRGRYR